jgi:hypothetical protein
MGIEASRSKGANELQDNVRKFKQKICDIDKDCEFHERSAFEWRRSSTNYRRNSRRDESTRYRIINKKCKSLYAQYVKC